MKKYIITSLLFFIPLISMASDHCTNPTEYTIDKRCYVTDEQKKEKPYNAVATLVSNYGGIHGSGTIVKRHGLTIDDSGYFLYTAKHCADRNNDNVADDNLKIRLPNGQEFLTTLVKQGNYRDTDGIQSNLTGDWAKYKVVTADKNDMGDIKEIIGDAYVKINDSFARGAKNVRIIGYGTLKIMSDQEIQKLKKEYLDFIEDQDFENTYFTEDGGIFGRGIEIFIKNNHQKFEDGLLKVSKCSQNAKSEFTGCQIWSGNSGGGAFDDKGNLMWIVTRGYTQIGGAGHISAAQGVNFLPFGRLPDEEKRIKKL